MSAVKRLLLAAMACACLSARSPAQMLQWIEPTLIGLPSARCCAPAVYDEAMKATLLFGGWNYTNNPATIFDNTWVFSKSTDGSNSRHPFLLRP
jgi:hypothetical protein